MNTLIPGAPLRSLSPTSNEYQRAEGVSRAAKPARVARFTLDAPEHSGTIPGARGDILTPGVALTSNLAVIFTLNQHRSSAFAFRPRFLDVIPTLAISSRWRRQLDNCDEYKPSRRRRAATSPSPLPKASASRTIRSLYSALKRRRFACSRTSGSSTPAASRPAGSVE